MSLAFLLLGSGQVWAISSSPSFEAGQLFEAHCAGCHPGGGNIIRRNKTLTLKALQQNKVDSVGDIVDLIRNGKNNMSAFGDRLSTSQIEDLASYVLAQAQQGWPKD